MPMATTRSNGGGSTITCPTCDHTVNCQPGSNRTICPNCGNFYSRDEAGRAPRARGQRRRGQEKKPLPDLDKDKNKQQGPLNSIANFFQNLGPSRRGKHRRDLSPTDSQGSSSSLLENNSGSKTELPPIDSQGHLTTTPSSRPVSYRSDKSGSSSLLSPGRSHRAPSGTSTITLTSSIHNTSKSRLSPNPIQGKVAYPVRTKTIEQIREDVKYAKETGNWKVVQEFYSTTFNCFLEINAVFKRDPNKEYKTLEESGLKLELVNFVYDLLPNLPQDIQKCVLKSIINSLLKDKKIEDSRMHWPHTKDDLRAYLIILQNPQFENMSTFVIFAHLLRQIAALNDHDHHFLVHWMRKLKLGTFTRILRRLHSFIIQRLFPTKPQDLPPLAKCTWWIPSATKVMALLNAANNLSSPLLVPIADFYNSSLDFMDLMAEYYTWQNPSHCSGFSFCQYPFILSISAKRSILQKDSEQQMIIMARRSLVAKVQRRQLPDVGMLFLNLNVRRSHIVSDSLNEIARKQHDLKKKLKVTFMGEAGLDMGGLTKEWFLLLIRQIFQSDYGMFTYDKKAGAHWFSTAPCESYQEFNLMGVLMGLAVYNSINLDIRFPPCCYKKLLSPAVVPYNNPNAVVGITQMTLEDFKLVQPVLAVSLEELLNYEGDVEEDFCMTFQISLTEYGDVRTVDLKTGGANIPVNKSNRAEYIQLYMDWIVNKGIYPQFKAFYHGFHSVCASNALIMLRPQEVEMLVCGNPQVDMNQLRKVASYDGYNAQDSTVRYFWDTVLSMTFDMQKKLLLFTTGSDRIPIGGMAEMTFKISRIEGTDLLPMSHTCFNQLVLPAYRSRKVLKTKLVTAIANAEGFGLE
ncbi:probable E3 ubiquitin-protein ligase HECTD2 isoform X1 [Mizuhopecten yessoensis]|uniref:probable E3 ubiquitin-protein ligase HECTD2 isoform X1 n=1 Tax=Mizuhopecten yessoensis TaxID=6573 RepID=UPI000B45C1DE|nr:probable E3 ubiquitin-protein ligase HECTD2 isoform X1 [Mizuhopecten yessoensis]